MDFYGRQNIMHSTHTHAIWQYRHVLVYFLPHFGFRKGYLAVAQLGMVHADRQAARVCAAPAERVRLYAQAAHLQLHPRRRPRMRTLACTHMPI